MDKELYLALIEFNKKEPEVFNETEIIRPKIRGGFRLLLYNLLEKHDFWNEIGKKIDGKEYISDFKEKFSNYKPEDLLKAMRDLYMKSGNIHNRKLIFKRPKELLIDSSIFCWEEEKKSYAKSNMMFYFTNSDVRGDAYSVKSEQDLLSLIEIICKENKIPQSF